MRPLTELQAADSYCRYLTNHHYENFSVASLLLPSHVRLHLARLYAYCRTTDDLGDESGGDAASRLTTWRSQLEQCFVAGQEPIHPVLVALGHTIEECHLPAGPFHDLITANMQDQRTSEYETWEDLRNYCLLSAAPVGRLVLRIWDVHDQRRERLSDDVCIGLQLANFAQDVLVDRGKHRTYLIQEDLRTHGLIGATEALCQRAAGLLASGHELETLVPRRLRIQLALYRLGGMAILSAIARIGYRTDRQRPHLSRATKLGLVAQAITASGRSGRYVSAKGVA